MKSKHIQGIALKMAPESRQFKPKTMVAACSFAVAALSMGYAPHAAAEGFTLDNGDEGQWSAGLTMGRAWRTTNPDPALYSKVYANDGRVGTGGDGNQDGDLNYGKGAPISTPFTFNGEVQLKHDNLGFVLGARAWYDETLEKGTVNVGSSNNGFNAVTGGKPGAALSDNGLQTQSKFAGVALTNAYVFGTFEPVDGKPVTVKLGDQVVNWGESLFIPGINQFGAYNLQALVTPGATIKDALLPIPQIDANWGIGEGLSLEAFYQFTWVKNVFPGCGTYWSPSDLLNCNSTSAPLLGDNTSGGVNQYSQLNGLTALNPTVASLKALGFPQYSPNFGVSAQPDIEAKNSGQWGASLHYYASSISTDFGLYAVAYRQRTPMLDLYATPSTVSGSVYTGTFNGVSPLAAIGSVVANATKAYTAAYTSAAAEAALVAPGGACASTPTAACIGAAVKGEVAAAVGKVATPLATLSVFTQPLNAGWDYSAPMIEEAGFSAATVVGGWSLAGEANYTKGVPVQFNPADMVTGYLLGQNPSATPTLAALSPATGAVYRAGAGPLATIFANDLKLGTIMQGYDLHNKLQLQMNTSDVLSHVAGAESLMLVGEVAVQKWSGIGDPATPGTIRYGRPFTFGIGSPNNPAVNSTICTALQPNASYCSDAGFDTPTAWGYRLQAELNYPNVIDGWNLKPKVYWAADVHGYSADSLFVQNREVLGLSVRADYLSKYYVTVTYTAFNHDATYDQMHDRDNIAAVVGVNF